MLVEVGVGQVFMGKAVQVGRGVLEPAQQAQMGPGMAPVVAVVGPEQLPAMAVMALLAISTSRSFYNG